MTKENLYKNIYYDMKVKNILNNTNEVQDVGRDVVQDVSGAAAVSGNKTSAKSKLRLQFLYNGILVLAVVLIFIFLTNAWFNDNEVTEAEQMQYAVYSSAIPVYTNLNFNEADCGEYDNTEIALNKAIIPGDVIDLSVFIELTDIRDLKTVKVTILDVPEWLDMIDKSEKVTYANKAPVLVDGDRIRITLEKFPNVSKGPTITDIAFSEDSIIFTVDVPDNYTGYDGLCIDFGLYFEDSDENQNIYMNETVRMRFTASRV